MSNVTRAAGVMLITALFYGLVTVDRLAVFHFDPTAFIVAGPEACRVAETPIPLMLYPGGGYDGQYYFRLALDPLTRQRDAYGITLDWPGCRQQRILYPALSYLLALGRPAWVPWTMIIVNYLAICALGFTGAMFACALGRDALWGLALPFYPGLLFAINRNLTEVLAVSLMVAALYLLYRRRLIAGTIAMTAAILTRETIVAVAGAALLEWAWRMYQRRARWSEGACLIVPLLVFAGWQAWLYATWGNLAFTEVVFDLGPPLKGWIEYTRNELGWPTLARVFVFYQLALIAGLILLAAAALIESTIGLAAKLAWAGFLLTVSRVTTYWVLYTHQLALLRATAELAALSFLIVMGSRYRKLFAVLLVLELVIWNVILFVYCTHYPYS